MTAHLDSLHEQVLSEGNLHEACCEQQHADLAQHSHRTQKPLCAAASSIIQMISAEYGKFGCVLPDAMIMQN